MSGLGSRGTCILPPAIAREQRQGRKKNRKADPRRPGRCTCTCPRTRTRTRTRTRVAPLSVQVSARRGEARQTSVRVCIVHKRGGVQGRTPPFWARPPRPPQIRRTRTYAKEEEPSADGTRCARGTNRHSGWASEDRYLRLADASRQSRPRRGACDGARRERARLARELERAMEAGGSSRARAVWFFFFFFFFVTVVNARRRSAAGGAGRNGVGLAGYLGGLLQSSYT